MNYELFLNSLSTTLAERFVEKYKSFQLQDSKFPVYGVIGINQTEVNDIVIEITKTRFLELVRLKTKGENVKSFEDRIFTELKVKRRCILEPLMTDTIRKNKIPFDCAFIQSDDKTVTLNFRFSSKLVTQNPQTFAPLFRHSFNVLHELIQGDYGITFNTDAKPVLATWHLASCVAFAAFNENYKVGILAHIDLCADVDDLFKNIKNKIGSTKEESLAFEYVLLGGIESSKKNELRERIKNAAQKAEDVFFKFKLVNEIEDKTSNSDCMKDSRWVTSMRLKRSIALDTRKSSLSESLMSYEPDLNENSSLHKRACTLAEAMAFEDKRKQEKKLNLAYFSVPKSS